MTRVARPLDALALGLGALAVGIIVTGGWTIAGVPLTRAEDVVIPLALVVGVRAFIHRYRLPHVRAERAVLAGVLIYAALMSFIAVTRHHALRTHALDLGYYVQVVWNIASGHGAWVTLPPMHAWGDHLSPVLYAFAPLAWIWPGAVPLLVGQTLILAAGGLAVFGLARHRLRDAGVAAALALLYLVNPSLHGINIRDIHPQAFAIALIPAAALAFEKRRYGWCALALGLALAGREDAAIAGVGFGVWMAVSRGRWLAGALVALASIAVLAIDITLLMPYFRGERYPHLKRYAYLGGSFGEILGSLVARPWRWLPVAFAPAKLLYLLAMLAPLGFLPLLAPRALAAALPALAVNLLSVDPILFHHRTQYQSFVLPFLVIAAIDGYRWLRAVTGRRRERAAISPATVLALAFVVSVVLTSRTVNDLMVTKWMLDADQRGARRLMEQIPPGVPASVHERFVPHLATRPEIYVFPFGLPSAEYVLVHASAAGQVPPTYGTIAREGEWILSKRR
ncbi:MAG: DUF2079 domain-containing protein [Candidatus Rokubacteria bacterium]|nr:DUF2079 domain-containing protein [Candidatus Rokubacteria bacterium]